jgi:putative transposase
MKKRRFTKAEKLKVLREASLNGVKITLEKYGIYPATYYSWKKKLESEGEENFGKKVSEARTKELKRLEAENQKLKEIVAEKELMIRMLKELRKKP